VPIAFTLEQRLSCRRGSLWCSSAELALLVAAGKSQLYAMLTDEAQDANRQSAHTGCKFGGIMGRSNYLCSWEERRVKVLGSISDLDTKEHDDRKVLGLDIL
jgi:hypothetical protein